MTPQDLADVRTLLDDPVTNHTGVAPAIVRAMLDDLERLQKATDPLATMRLALDALPDEQSRQEALAALLVNRCRKCLDYDPQNQFWCCYESRGD